MRTTTAAATNAEETTMVLIIMLLIAVALIGSAACGLLSARNERKYWRQRLILLGLAKYVWDPKTGKPLWVWNDPKLQKEDETREGAPLADKVDGLVSPLWPKSEK